WMANSGNGLTKGGNLKHADLNTDDISHDIIIRAFKKYGISNCLSESEDHLIYKDDSKNSDDADVVEDLGKDTGEDTGKGSDENTNKENDFNNWPECFV
ncbi:23353_t:CDS:2, partial [Cetraspora pellucida]